MVLLDVDDDGESKTSSTAADGIPPFRFQFQISFQSRFCFLFQLVYLIKFLYEQF